nr:hypothetical protein [Deltaproteobacteria bacterium]
MDFETTGAFYRAAHLGLRVLDGRGVRRRFGAEADGRWQQFRGDMTDADRLDLLIKDAATIAPLAFAPRDVFALPGLSTEDPFGTQWPGARPGLGGGLFREGADAPADALAAFDAAVALWGLRLDAFDAAALPRILPGTRLVVGGLAALRAVVAHSPRTAGASTSPTRCSSSPTAPSSGSSSGSRRSSSRRRGRRAPWPPGSTSRKCERWASPASTRG